MEGVRRTQKREPGVVFCSFCDKSQHEVEKVIAGPSVFICNECVYLCLELVEEEQETSEQLTFGDFR